MSKELKTTQSESQKASDFDLYLSLLTKRQVALNIIKNTKNQFVKKDRYRQVCKLNKEIETLKRRLKL